MRRRATKQEKEEFVFQYLERNTFGCGVAASVGTFDEEFSTAWQERFPHHKAKIYTIGPDCVPAANSTLRSMWKEGKLLRQTIGNQLAREFCQPTYCYLYRAPEHGIGESWEEWCERTDRDRYGRRRIRFSRR